MLSIILPRIYTTGQKLERILPQLILDAPQSPALQKRLLELQNISTHFGKNNNEVIPEGEFWINKFKNNNKQIIHKLNQIDQIKLKKFTNIYKKYKPSLFYKDKGNLKLKNLLS